MVKRPRPINHPVLLQTRVSTDLGEAIQAEADRRGVTRSVLIRQALQAYLGVTEPED